MEKKYIDTAKELLFLDSKAVESLLDTLYVSSEGCGALLDEAARYSLMAGGKRVRPALVLEFCRLFGGDVDRALPFAAAIEMTHTQSLIHDDLPAIDDDDLRRGRPTNHKVYGEAIAIFAGDAMTMDAYKLLVSADFEPRVLVDAVRILSSASGESGMIRGQVIDIYGESHRLTLEELLTLHKHKTGALIRASAQLGVLAAGYGMESPQMKAAEEYAEKVGLAFQVVDDILDATATVEELGKSVGGDAEHNKNTFLTFYSVEDAAEYASSLTEDAIRAIEKYEGSERLISLARYLAVRTN